MLDASSAVVVGALESEVLSKEEELIFSQENLTGIVLFKRNISKTDYRQTSILTRTLQSLRSSTSPPFLVAIDQEGGRVSRIPNPFPNLGSALKLFSGQTDAESLLQVEAYSQNVAKELKSLGVHINFAPVVDILTQESNQAIGDRAFGRDQETVTLRAGAFLAGHRQAGISGCLKHFPGQGHAFEDTHLQSATISVPLEILTNRELKPFQKLLPVSPFIMLSHCVYPALDDKPASLSSAIIEDLLRKKMGFAGITVSDDMNMGAISQDLQLWQAAIVASVAAGIDLVLVCRGLERMQAAVEALRSEAKRSSAFAKRLEIAAQRVMTFRHSLL
jgi:beta-N-acetylhexosaminidase